MLYGISKATSRSGSNLDAGGTLLGTVSVRARRTVSLTLLHLSSTVSTAPRHRTHAWPLIFSNAGVPWIWCRSQLPLTWKRALTTVSSLAHPSTGRAWADRPGTSKSWFGLGKGFAALQAVHATDAIACIDLWRTHSSTTARVSREHPLKAPTITRLGLCSSCLSSCLYPSSN